MAKDFAKAEGIRVQITNEQAKQIKQMYKDLANECKKELNVLATKTNISSQMRTEYLNEYIKNLEDSIEYLNKNVQDTITSNMLRVSQAVVNDSIDLDKKMGFQGIFTKQFYIPHDVVAIVSSGKLYEGKWTLSKAIWSDNQKKISDIQSIVARGIAGNKSTYDIAKDLERYVNPRARKLWDWSKVYPHTSKKIDYNAQRLARTMVSHAYQEAFVESTKDNPFIESYRWLASGGDRMCPICEDMDGQIFAKDDLPLDHPNGMCTFETVIEKSYEDIAKDLANWVNGEGDPRLNEALDNYAETLGYNFKSWTPNSEPVRQANEIIQDVKTKLEDFVSGGISISDTFRNDPEGLEYIKEHMKEYDKTFYRMERNEFTANGLKVGDTFSFDGDIRSFSGSYSGVRQIMSDISEFDNVSQYTMFKTMGEQEAFDVNSFINNQFFANQDEYLLGGKFEVIGIKDMEIFVNGERHEIRQILIR